MVASPGGLSVVNDLLGNVRGCLLFSDSGLDELHLQVSIFCRVDVIDINGHGVVLPLRVCCSIECTRHTQGFQMTDSRNSYRRDLHIRNSWCRVETTLTTTATKHNGLKG